jgi:uracil-DNA glycosylase family 4
MSTTSSLFQAFAAHTATYNIEIQCAMDGDPSAKIAFVGEYPGEHEVAFNKPFIGAAGKHLWNVVRKYGLNRTNVYTTNVIKRRVSVKTPVHYHEFSLWQEALQWELSQLPNLEVIVCLGNNAMQAVLGFDGINKHRGSVYSHNGYQVLCANNPALVLRMPETEIIFLMDMQKLQRVVTGDYKPHHVNKIINPSFTEAWEYLDDIQRKHFKFSIDIETVAYETACIGIGISPHDAMCINFRDASSNRFTALEEYQLIRKFIEVCDDPGTFVIAQNGNFDAHFMGFKDHAQFVVDFDTLLAHHTLYPLLPHNLGFLTAQYTDHPFYKDDKDAFREGGDIDAFWNYNCTDCAITYAIYQKLEEELKDQQLHHFFTNHVMRIQPHLVTATVTGEAVDVTVKDKLNGELQQDLENTLKQLEHAIQQATGSDRHMVNPSSPKQVTELLFDVFKCKAPARKADASTREYILKDPRTPIEVKNVVTILNRYAEEHKFYSTYVNTNIDSDGRFRAEYKQYGVTKAPGRLSSAGTLWGTGGNAQNQPHRAYQMFVSDSGTVYIYFDLSQAEARYVGWDADIEHWKVDFEKARIDGKFDAHRSLAAVMYNVPYEEVPIEDQDEDGNHTIRWTAKRCRHGLNYRMHIARLAQTTGMSYPMAAQNYYKYHQVNPQLQLWWKALEREVKKSRMLYNSYGRRLFFAQRLDTDDALESIVAFRPQSTIGDKVQRVWDQCHSDDRWDRSKAVIRRNVHDALWGVATPEYADTALSIMKYYAEEPIMVRSIMTGRTEKLVIPADMKKSFADDVGLHRMSNMQNMKHIEPIGTWE